MSIKLAIFDFDGTLMDTRAAIVTAKQETMRRLSLPVPDEEACARTIGLTSRLGFLQIDPRMDEKTVEQCVESYRSIFEEEIKRRPPALFEGVTETLQALTDSGIFCTIATSRNRRSLTEFLEQSDLLRFFPYILAAEDTTAQKPDPMPVLKTLEDLPYEARESLMIGDMPYDILMGKRAGTFACGVSYGNASKEELLEAGADRVIDSFRDLCKVITDF